MNMTTETKRVEAEAKSLFHWDWRAFALVALAAIPIPIVAIYNVQFALAMVIGLIPAVFASVGPTRKSRTRILVLGVAIPASLLVGSLLSAYTNRWIAGIALVALAALVAFMLTRGRPMWLALIAPVTAIGLSFDAVETTLGFSIIMLMESVFAFGISQLFPKRNEPAPPKPPALPVTAAREFGVLYGLALFTAVMISWGWDHMGWVVGSVGLVMRPSHTMQSFRSLWRIASILGGLIIVSAFVLMHPPAVVAALFAAIIIVLCAGLNESRAYIMPFFMTICIFLVIEYPITGVDEVFARFLQRFLEVGLGVLIAYVFGLLIPLVIKFIRKKGSKGAAGQQRP